MLLDLLVYSYATGVFSSHQIERSSHENVAMRLLCADTHPDHDTICAFRRKNAHCSTTPSRKYWNWRLVAACSKSVT